MSESHDPSRDRAVHSNRVDTSAVAPRERFDFWQASVLGAPLPLDAQPADFRTFAARLLTVESSALFLSRVTGSSHHIFRTPGGIARRSDGTCMAMLINAGSAAVTQGGGTAVAFTDDVLILDMDEPWDVLHQNGCDITFVLLPGEPLRGRSTRAGPAVLTARTTPLAPIVASYIRALPTEEDSLSVVKHIARDQLTALAERALGQRMPPPQSSLIDAVRNTIEAEISNPDLSAKLLCQRLGVSRTSLFEALASERITLGSTIRERRFAGCRADIERAAATGTTVSEIAERWGYRDLASFSRAFKNRFGVAPTRWAAAR